MVAYCGITGNYDPIFTLVMIAAVFGVPTVFEVSGYMPKVSRSDAADWVKTDETFLDPVSGREVTVYEHAETGERVYAGPGETPPAA